jgi:hypothetical protein
MTSTSEHPNPSPKKLPFYKQARIFLSSGFLLGVALFLGLLGIMWGIQGFLPAGKPYMFSNFFWYADFRYWSDWISGCCWLALAWAVVSTLLALIIPKNKERIFSCGVLFFKK